MSKPAKVLLFYYIFLGVTSLTFSLLNIQNSFNLFAGQRMEFNFMILPTIVGGIVSLAVLISKRSLKIFLVVYFGLWILRFILLYISKEVGSLTVFGSTFSVDLIVSNYYKMVSRLDTHLPFVLYWFIDYFFKSRNAKEDDTAQQPSAETTSGDSLQNQQSQ